MAEQRYNSTELAKTAINKQEKRMTTSKNSSSLIFALILMATGVIFLPTIAWSQITNPDFPDYEYEDTYYYDDDHYSDFYDDDDNEHYISPYATPYHAEEIIPEPEIWEPKLEPGAPINLAKKTIRIGRIPFRSLRQMMAQAVPLLGFIKKQTQAHEVRMVSSSKDYSSVVDALVRGNVDFAWISAAAYLRRRDTDKLLPVAKTKFGQSTSYRGVFIARAGGKIQGLEDIKGNTIGFVDPQSASGYIYPLYLLHQLKINAHKDANVVFLGNHDNVVRAILAGKIDAGVCLENTLNSINDLKIKNQLLVLGKTHEIPSDVIVCLQDCPINLRESFLAALQNVPSQLMPGSLTFLPATNEDFTSVQAVMNFIESSMRKGR